LFVRKGAKVLPSSVFLVGNGRERWSWWNRCSSCGSLKATKSYSSLSLVRCWKFLKNSSAVKDTPLPNWLLLIY